MKRYLILLALCALAACSTTGNPLPLVAKDDPTWALAPDHLDMGSLPK